VSRARDEWLARRAAAAKVVPRPVVSSATATRVLFRGWHVTLRGHGLVPLGIGGSVEVGGVPLENATFMGTKVTGWLRRLPRITAVTVDLGTMRLPAVPLRIERRPLLLSPEGATPIVERLRDLLGSR
jgi:hypothetical protein